MDNKGFTMVELLVVVAILAIASGLIATRFFKLTGEQDDYEDKVLAKSLAEAAYVYYNKEDNSELCITAGDLINSGYISPQQGLLKKYTEDEIKKFAVKVEINNGEKVTKVYKSISNSACDESTNNCCTNGTEK